MDTPSDNQHLPLSTIRDYANGTHGIEDSERILDHLSYCSECRSLLVKELQDSSEQPSSTENLLSQSNRTAPLLVDILGYRDIRPLGKGGMGTIYSAVQEGTQRAVAIKCITANSDTPIDADRAKRAFREARALAQLSHPNIVSVIEVLVIRQLPALVMEYIQGLQLDTWIATNRPDAIESAKIALQLADAVDHAHRRGILHCDLKPQNILIETGEPSKSSDSPRVKLIDFGLAKIQREDLKITSSGEILGTPAYMAPEQASGDAYRATQAVDIYGIGTVLYELLAGRPPFGATDRTAMLAQILHHPPILPSKLTSLKIPKDLETVCLKCLEKSPSDRYLSAAELSRDLQAVIQGDSIEAKRPKPWVRWRKLAQNNPALTLSFLCLTLLGVIGIATAMITERKNKQLSQEMMVISSGQDQARTQADQAEEQLLEELRISLKQMAMHAFGSHPDQNSAQQKTIVAIGKRWQVFAERLEGSPKSQLVRAEANLRMGIVHNILGDNSTALEKLRLALDLFHQINLANPSQDIRYYLAETHHHLAIVLHEEGDLNAAIECFRNGLQVIEDEISKPDKLKWKQYEIQTRLRMDFGTLLTLVMNFEQAKQQLEEANQILEKAQKNSTSDAESYEIAIKQCHCSNRIALLYLNQARIQESLQALEQISETAERVALTPDGSSEAFDACAMHQNLVARCFTALGRFDQAKTHIENAIGLQRSLVKLYPSIRILQSQLASTLNTLAYVDAQKGMMNTAVDASLESLQLHDALIQDDPNHVGYRFEQASALSNLVAIHTAVNNFNQAREYSEKLIAARRNLYDSDPKRTDYANGLAAALNVVGSLLINTNEFERANLLLTESEQIYEQLVEVAPSSLAFRSGLAKAHLLRAETACKTENWAHGVMLFAQAIEVFRSQNSDQVKVDRHLIHRSYIGQAAAYKALGDQESMQACLDQAKSFEN